MKTNSFKAKKNLQVGSQTYSIYSLAEASRQGLSNLNKLPFSLKVLLENLLRKEDGDSVTESDIKSLANWKPKNTEKMEIAFSPSRVLMQDFTGVPAVCDLAAMRGSVANSGLNPSVINPLTPVDLVIDHSVMVDNFGSTKSFDENVAIEMERNQERYKFLKWGQGAFENFRVIPPGTGICHQVNLEYLAKVVWTAKQGDELTAYPDTLVGTDSHTTMVNGLGVLGWGVGGIEAEAAMLGQPISMLVPDVVGFELKGKLASGVTATDLVLTIVEMLRKLGVVGKFVEFFGDGLSNLSLADRATISNMAPEYGATCGFFSVDNETLKYLHMTGRDEECCALVEAYAKEQGLWRTPEIESQIQFTNTLSLNLDEVTPCLAGPKRPQDRVTLGNISKKANETIDLLGKNSSQSLQELENPDRSLSNGDVVIAAITSCTNTSNPSVMIAAGMVAQKAVELGVDVKPWVKTSLAPGSQVVTDYLEKTGVQKYLDKMGFNLVGYGCTTCIGNSGPLPAEISSQIKEKNLVVASVLSGNRNFEGRVHQEIKMNWLASPPLVVAYAIAGTTKINLETDALAKDANGMPVYLKDIWPGNDEINKALEAVNAEMFINRYKDANLGPKQWQIIDGGEGLTYNWPISTYISEPPFFSEKEPRSDIQINDADILAIFGDSVTTDHISPAGAIAEMSPAGQFLQSMQISKDNFNSYGSRRGNHEVMMRGTFANIRIRNEMLDNVEGGYTRNNISGETQSIYDAAVQYQEANRNLVVIAGKEYGTGSSRDWAAKGTMLLGVKAVIAESFERIHRSNLIGMGVLPIQFPENCSKASLNLTGEEKITIAIPEKGDAIQPAMDLDITVTSKDGKEKSFSAKSRLDTNKEVQYYQDGGILNFVLNKLKATSE